VEVPIRVVETEDRRVLEPGEVRSLHVQDLFDGLLDPGFAGFDRVRDLVLFDEQVRTVRSESGVEFGLDLRREVPPVVRRREQDVARLVVVAPVGALDGPSPRAMCAEISV